MTLDVDAPPDPERVPVRDHVRGLVVSALVALIWVGLAVWRPTTTLHLAPTVVAAAWPYALRRGPLRASSSDAARAAAGAAALAIVTGVVLAALDLMRGPTLWDGGPALTEVPIAAAVGAVVGYRYARCGVAFDPD